MAIIKRIRNADGSVSFGAQVRVKPFKPTWKSFATKAEAARWRDELTSELKKQRTAGNARPDLATLTLAALNKAYLEDPETTALRYHKELKRSLAWWTLKYGTVKVIDFGVLQLREARDALMPGRAAATVVRRLAAQRSAWNWGRAAGLVAKDRAWPRRLMLREAPARVRYLSDDELAAVLRHAKASSAVLHAAITVSIATGIRQGELLRLTWADIDFARERIQLLITKNGTARSVHLPATAAAVLKELKAAPVVSATTVFLNTDGKALSINQLDKLWRKVRTAAKLENFRWHDLRHTAASYLAQAGASLLEIGSVLGHRSAGITMKYSHLVEGAPVTGHSKLDEKLRGAPK